VADGPKLKLSGAHHAALADFSDVMQELLVQDWSSLVLGGGTVLAMHWHHRHSTDLDFIVEEDEPLHAGALRNRLAVLQRQGRIDVWRYARRRSVMLTAGGVRLSFVFEGVDAGVPADGRTAMDIRCESPGSILGPDRLGHLRAAAGGGRRRERLSGTDHPDRADQASTRHRSRRAAAVPASASARIANRHSRTGGASARGRSAS